MKLYRPTGINELRLVYQAGMRAWPPRLDGQPIFYPVLNLEYAEQIARDWNAPSDCFAGFATSFEVASPYVDQFEIKVVGGSQHEELWVPAESLPDLNRNLTSAIKIESAFFGAGFSGEIPRTGPLAGLVADVQLEYFTQLRGETPDGLADLVNTERQAVFLNFAYWLSSPDADSRLLSEMREIWERRSGDLRLPDGRFLRV